MGVAWQYTPVLIPLLAAGVLATLVALYGIAVRRRSGRSLLVMSFAVLNLAVATWALVYAAQVASPSLPAKMVAYQLLHVGGVLVPPAWVVFAAAYADYDRWVTPATVGALLLVPVALLLTLPTNPWSLAITDARLVEVGGIYTLETGNGPLYVLFLAYSYVLLLVGSALVARAAIHGQRLYSAQSLLLLTGATVPFAFNLIEVAGVSPLGAPGINYTPVSLSISVFLFGVALFRYRLFDLQPVARRTVFEHVREGVIVLNEAERIVGTNDAASQFLDAAGGIRVDGDGDESGGWPDPVGRPAAAVVPEYDTLGSGPDEFETITFDRGDERRIAEARRSPLERDGNRRGWVVLLRDVTAREEYIREIERRNERLDEFASVVAHDLRNPLDVLAGHARLARETGDDEHLDAIEGTATRMGRLLENVLRLARRGRTIAEPRPVSVADVARDAWTYVDEEDATLAVDTDATVRADPDALGQLFENLFRNSADHGTTSGQTDGDEPGVRIRVGELDGRDGIFVEDDGPGFDGDPTRLFDPGYSTDAVGTGLGLHVVEQIADAHEWDLASTDGDDGGFRIEITSVEFSDRADD